MKNYFKSMSAYLVVSILVFSACSEDAETTQPTVEMRFNTINSASSVPTGARVAANSLEFDSVEVNIQQNVVIDFATGATTPDLGSLNFPVGTYTEIRVELELLDENNVPSVIIEGTFVDSNDESHPIRFEFNSGETFEVEKEGVITFTPGTSAIALVTFDPLAWFAEVTSSMLEAATKNADGVIVISETSNSEIFDMAADGLDLATEVEIQL
jgi:uncharacterized membrane protein